MPSAEDLPPEYQPLRYSSDPSVLQRLRFKPAGDGPWPVVVIIPAAVYKVPPLWGPKGQRQAFKDLTDAGYLVFSVNHRSAPGGLICMQPAHDQNFPENGRPPQQSNDIKQQIMAAAHDSECNGTVFVIGASSGGTHAFWVALDPEQTVPDWGPGEIPKAVVGLSGGYDLSWRDADPDQEEILSHFLDVVRNYTKTCCQDNPTRLAYQLSVSPISLLTSVLDPDDIPPLRLFTTAKDTMPYQQMDIMAEAFITHGFSNFVARTVGEDLSKHAFEYWHTREYTSGPLVSEDVIAFFNANRP